MNPSTPQSFKYASKGLIALALTGVVLQLPGCGGGGTTSGAPLNPAPGPAAPAPLAVNPANVTLYVNQPSSLFVSGGVAPYSAFSSNPALLPVLQGVIGSVIPIAASGAANSPGGTTAITVTVTDSAGQSIPAAVTVIPSPFLVGDDAFVIKGANCDSSLGNITDITCAGQTATATLKLIGPTGAPLSGRQIRFEALQGQYSFVLNDAATELAKSITVTTDSQGVAIVRMRIDFNAITSFGLIRATDLTSGARVDKSFPIAQITNGEAVLTASPSKWAIKGAYKGECSSNFEVSYYIFGGTPPYRVVSSVPGLIGVGNTIGGSVGGTTTVSQNGGFFTGKTLSGCILNDDPIIFITDATGRTIGVGLENAEGDTERPTPPPPAALSILPSTVVLRGDTATGCVGTSAQTFIYSGGGSVVRALVTNTSGTPSSPVPGTVRVVSGGTQIGPGAYQLSGSALVVEFNGPFGFGRNITEITLSDGTTSSTAKVVCGGTS